MEDRVNITLRITDRGGGGSIRIFSVVDEVEITTREKLSKKENGRDNID